jgi:hypothetical protein
MDEESGSQLVPEPSRCMGCPWKSALCMSICVSALAFREKINKQYPMKQTRIIFLNEFIFPPLVL